MFDLGNVLIEWNPRRVFPEEFIEETDFYAWNGDIDRGASFASTVASMRERFPLWADRFDAFRDRWPDILGPVDHDVVAIVDELRGTGVRLYVLSNSSAETVPRSASVLELLARFDGVLLSGEVGLLKPDPAIYALAVDRFGLDPSATLFVDDSPANVEAAIACGWQGHHFTGASELSRALVRVKSWVPGDPRV